MKTKILTLFLLLSAAVASAETMRVAILEPVDRENKVNYGTKLILRSNLAKAVTNTAGYEAYDRSDMDAIMGEQNFQRTGMVSEDQIKRLGEMTGAKFILVAEAAIIDAQNMFITAKVLDVETARTVMTDNLMMGMDAKKIQEGCATLAGNLFSPVKSTKTSETMGSPIKTQSKNDVAVAPKALTKEGKYYYYNGTEMDRKAYERFLKDNCSKAAHKYQTGRQVVAAGWAIGTVGLLVTAVGIPVTAGFIDKTENYFKTHAGYEPQYSQYYSSISDYEKAKDKFHEEYKYEGVRLYSYGSTPYFRTQAELEQAKVLEQKYSTAYDLLFATAIGGGILTVGAFGVMLPIGYAYEKKSIDIFNTQCASQPAKPAVTFNLQSHPNSIGLALNF